MNHNERTICWHISETSNPTFSELSLRTRLSTSYLSQALANLVGHGFVVVTRDKDGFQFCLNEGVAETLLQ